MTGSPFQLQLTYGDFRILPAFSTIRVYSARTHNQTIFLLTLLRVLYRLFLPTVFALPSSSPMWIIRKQFRYLYCDTVEVECASRTQEALLVDCGCLIGLRVCV